MQEINTGCGTISMRHYQEYRGCGRAALQVQVLVLVASAHNWQFHLGCRCTVFSNYAEANCPETSKALPTLVMGDGSAPASR
jgi:hypothetical protein